MLPKGWRRSMLGEIARISSGGTPDRSELSYWGGDVPWVTTSEIRLKTITDTKEKITQAGLKNSSAKLFPPDTLLMAMYGQGKTRGQIAKLGIEAATNQACAAILLTDADAFEPDFFLHYLSSQYDAIRELGNAGTQQNLSGSIIKGIDVPVPPLPEQRRIAKILSIWDQSINVTENLLANSSKQKDVLANALLKARRRLVGYGNWTNKKIADLIVESRVRGSGGDVAKKITVKLYGRGVVGKSEKRLGSESTQYYRRVTGQFIYSKLDFLNGAFGLVPEALDGYESTLDLPAFDFLHGVDPRWFLYFVSREDFYLGHLGLANGGRKARRVNPMDLLRVTVRVPELAEQKAIADVLDVAQAEINNFTDQLRLLREQKTSLVAQLMTGKRRVHLPASELERAA